MGYYTSYSLTVYGTEDLKEEMEIIGELKRASSEANYALDEYGDVYQSTKWYDHEGELRRFSERYPDIVFELSGEGEEAGDLWIKYFRNSTVAVCKGKIVYPDPPNWAKEKMP